MAKASYIKQKKLQELATEELGREIERTKTSVKIMEEEEKKVNKMEKQERLSYKFSEKLQFLPKNDLCENSSSF